MATPSQRALIEALRAHPRGHDTASELALRAGIGTSTARRVLGELAEQGTIIRTTGLGNGPGRTPDHWSLFGETTDDDAEPAIGAASLAMVPAPSEEGSESIGTHEQAPEPTPDPGMGEPLGGGQVTGSKPDPTSDATTPQPQLESLPAHTDADPATKAGTEPDTADSAADTDPGLTSETRARAGKNELRGKVEQYLIEHPDEEFGPHALGQALGHSSGAITNVLHKLLKAGYARQTQTSPRRFAASGEHPE